MLYFICVYLSDSVKPAEIKIIDFGSACMEDRTVYSYIQVPDKYFRLCSISTFKPALQSLKCTISTFIAEPVLPIS